MRRKLVAGNWKMNLTPPEGAAMIETLLSVAPNREDTDVVICPPYLAIPKAQEVAKDSHIAVGAQDVFWLPKGAFTGRISAGMLASVGCRYCIVGHSETRGRFGKLEVPQDTIPHFGETDKTVNLKIGALIENGIVPILCVGETQVERDASMTDAIITTQLEKALSGHSADALKNLVVAYEPVWAIGTGNVCEPPEAERVCGMVRTILGEIIGDDIAEGNRVLYGGSVKASNAPELFQCPNIDGGLVGGACLDPNEFAEIIKAV